MGEGGSLTLACGAGPSPARKSASTQLLTLRNVWARVLPVLQPDVCAAVSCPGRRVQQRHRHLLLSRSSRRSTATSWDHGPTKVRLVSKPKPSDGRTVTSQPLSSPPTNRRRLESLSSSTRVISRAWSTAVSGPSFDESCSRGGGRGLRRVHSSWPGRRGLPFHPADPDRKRNLILREAGQRRPPPSCRGQGLLERHG